MSTLAWVSACLSIAIGTWFGQRLFYRAYQRYREQMTTQARSELSELFVFIDLTHFWPALVWLASGIMMLVWLSW
jgi:hypothetical protein